MRRDHRIQSRPRFSRRQVLTAAASAGVGVAAVSVAGLSAAGDEPTGSAQEPIVVHLRDPKSGTLEVFVGGSRIELRDSDLAARLRRAARRG